ncbi:MAG: MarR family winged helix-turn-helix transcriptional regulator [Burkholderiales bacterium]|jgi:DNA-binding MarR family transcriptional regulator|nr:MarR family winged helix-turn-helix transcriptional regulator [Burkholderiales bacterium]
MSTDEPRPGDKRYQIVNYVGIADQLLTTRANQILGVGDLPFAQFVMLNHFSHEPDRARRVTEVASAMQQPQPTVTRTLQRLVRKGYLEVRAADDDARARVHVLTRTGKAAHRRAIERLMPEVAARFADWDERDVETLHRLLFRLMRELDEARGGAPAPRVTKAARRRERL